MTSERRASSARISPMLHICTSEGCTTIVFGRGLCVEHEPRRVALADALLAEAAAAAHPDEVSAETTGGSSRQE